MNISRRRLIARGSAAALLEGLGIGALYGPALAGTSLARGLDRLTAAVSDFDVIVVKDLPHTVINRSYALLGSDEFLNHAQKADFRLIANELPDALQDGIDNLQGAVRHGELGKHPGAKLPLYLNLLNVQFSMPAEESEDAVKGRIMAYVENAARHSIKVLAGDKAIPDEAVNQAAVEFPRLHQQLTDPTLVPTQRGAIEQQEANDTAILVTAGRSRQANRPLVDQVLAEKAKLGGRAMIVFGLMHDQPLVSLLTERHQKVATVALHASKAAYEQSVSDYAPYKEWFTGDVNFMLDSGEVIAPLRQSRRNTCRLHP